MAKTQKLLKARCEINECQIPVTLDGVTINPGDYIFGDIDGVVIIPKDVIDEVIDRALESIEKENEVRRPSYQWFFSPAGICRNRCHLIPPDFI